MVEIRSIQPDELAMFATTATPPDHVAAVQRYLLDLIARGAMRPGWCLLAEHADGRPFGRAAFRALPGQDRPADLVLLDLAWRDAAAMAAGRRVLSAVLRVARDLGCEQIEHVLDTPAQWPQWQHEPARRMALLERCGFALERETYRFEAPAELAGLPPATSSPELVWRSLPEVGEDAFRIAIALVSAGSADRRTAASRRRLGADGQAAALFAHLRSFAHAPEWWELAFLPDGRLVGLVAPIRTAAHATIGYIGIVPELRGRHLVGALLARGSATLQRDDALLVRGDTDVRNTAMAQAFRRAGFTPFATRREYTARLPARHTAGSGRERREAPRGDGLSATIHPLRPAIKPPAG
jgi:RimJ/RimL family protein N-acetyltransferase